MSKVYDEVVAKNKDYAATFGEKVNLDYHPQEDLLF